MKKFLVHNLPLSKGNFFVNDNPFDKYYNLINYSLLELIDKTIKVSLEEYKEEYCIMGGKALNKKI